MVFANLGITSKHDAAKKHRHSAERTGSLWGCILDLILTGKYDYQPKMTNFLLGNMYLGARYPG